MMLPRNYWAQLAEAQRRTADPRELYDYVGYLNKYGTLNPNDTQSGHYTDEFKLPGHPTFSNESIYSNSATPGGSWGDNRFYHSDYTVNHSDETNRYLLENDPGYKAVYKGGTVLPEIRVNARRRYTTGKDEPWYIPSLGVIDFLNAAEPWVSGADLVMTGAPAAGSLFGPIGVLVGSGLKGLTTAAAAGIDVAQAARAAYDGDAKSAVINTGEAALNVVPLGKAIEKTVKAVKTAKKNTRLARALATTTKKSATMPAVRQAAIDLTRPDKILKATDYAGALNSAYDIQEAVWKPQWSPF